ncbi:hypothetical protein [Corynebacterium mastitidis]
MKKFLVKTMAAVLAVSAVAPGVAHADRWTKIKPAQCKAAIAAAEAGQEIANPDLLRIDNNAMVGDTLEVYVTTKRFEPAVDEAIRAWSEASDGAIKIVKVDKPTAHSVEIRERDIGHSGEMVWSPKPHLILNPAVIGRMNLQNQALIAAHELGHAMGLAHGCSGTVMRGRIPGYSSLTPTALDVAAVRQGRF